MPGVDATDFFNYGLTPETWKDYQGEVWQYRQEFEAAMQAGAGRGHVPPGGAPGGPPGAPYGGGPPHHHPTGYGGPPPPGVPGAPLALPAPGGYPPPQQQHHQQPGYGYPPPAAGGGAPMMVS